MIDNHHMHLQQFNVKRPNLSSFKHFDKKKEACLSLFIK